MPGPRAFRLYGIPWEHPPLLADVTLRTPAGSRSLGPIFATQYGSAFLPVDALPAGPYELVFTPAPARGAALFAPEPIYPLPIVVRGDQIHVQRD